MLLKLLQWQAWLRLRAMSETERREFSYKKKKTSNKLKKRRAWTDRGIESEASGLLFQMGASDWQKDDSLPSPFSLHHCHHNPHPRVHDGALIKHANSFRPSSAGSAYGFVSCFFFWYFLKCDWMATAAFSVSGASKSMSKSSGGTSFLEASVDGCVIVLSHTELYRHLIEQITSNNN